MLHLLGVGCVGIPGHILTRVDILLDIAAVVARTHIHRAPYILLLSLFLLLVFVEQDRLAKLARRHDEARLVARDLGGVVGLHALVFGVLGGGFSGVGGVVLLEHVGALACFFAQKSYLFYRCRVGGSRLVRLPLPQFKLHYVFYEPDYVTVAVDASVAFAGLALN